MPDGPLLPAINAARNLLRDCYYWRRLADPLDPWDEATSEAHVHLDELPAPDPGPDHTRDELIALRPFALVWMDTAGGYTMRFDTTGNCCPVVSGTVIYQIELPVPEALADSPTELAEYLHTEIGRLLRTGDATKPGMAELNYLPIKQLGLRGYVRCDKKSAIDLGDFAVAEIELQWGQD